MRPSVPGSLRAPAPARLGGTPLAVWMLLAIGAVTGLAGWDSQRESEAILQDVGREQGVVAAVVARDLRAHLAIVERDALLVAERGPTWGEGRYAQIGLRASGSARPSEDNVTALLLTVPVGEGRLVDLTVQAADLVGNARPPESPREIQLFIAPPNATALYAGDGRVLSFSLLRHALDANQTTARLSRADAASIGLMARMAMAGFAHVDAGVLGRWGVVAVATAAPQRDREKRAFWRLLLSVAVASVLVLVFGGTALRNQRKELEASRALAVADLERQRDEHLSRADRIATMGTFAMGVVHEVSTPLGVIMGRAEQLYGRADQDERSLHAEEVIIEQVGKIQVIVRRFLDLARGGPPSLARSEPGDVVRSAVSSVEHRFAKAQVSLSADVPADGNQILCDRALLEQALVNLLLNACDACAVGGRVEISTRSDAEQAVFVVTDDGVGIEPEAAARATDPFFTTKPMGAGTGLGLAIAAEIAKSHRGALMIAPNGDRGSRACIEIPVALKVGAQAHG
jgi:two-component system, NtrC family, sensor kinase